MGGWYGPTIGLFFFFFNDPATTEIYTLPYTTLFRSRSCLATVSSSAMPSRRASRASATMPSERSEEHTSELQSQSNLVCRLLLEKKNKKTILVSTESPVLMTPHNLSSLNFVILLLPD